jgi:N,N'-diacetyllegionaminate synthase
VNLDNVLIIAEAGVNHNGNIETALELIDIAARSGADVVKFQTFKAEHIVSRKAKKAAYQSLNFAGGDDSQFAMLKSLELSDSDHNVLKSRCEALNIQFLSTAFDINGLAYLEKFNLPFFKSPSGELTNFPYLKKLAQIGKPVILSTGMANIKEIQKAVEVLCQYGLNKSMITVLHCNTEYPTPMEDVNLIAMRTIANEIGVKVGYSDHTLGWEVPVAAVALGAKVIEKHYTLSRDLPGPDHRASLEPDELLEMVKAIRNIERAISGDGLKKPSNSELKNIDIARKSIHTAIKIDKGVTITDEMIIPLRPGNGISPMKWDDIIGKKVLRNYNENEILREEDLI